MAGGHNRYRPLHRSREIALGQQRTPKRPLHPRWVTAAEREDEERHSARDSRRGCQAE